MFHAEALDAHIRERMEKDKIPGLSLTFSDDSGVFFARAYGHMREDKTAVREDTIFGVASMSKSPTGACIALLEHEGKLSINDPVTRFFPDFKIPGTPKDSLLISHLLTHTSGLPPLPTLLHCTLKHTASDPGQELNLDGVELMDIDTAEDIIRYIRQGDYEPLGQPGEYMSYSNDGYAILSSIVDRAAGKPMEEYIQEKLFSPLGMTRSALGYHRLKDFDNVTQLFTKQEDGRITASDNWSMAPPYRGCGWIISTSGDMHNYYKALSQRGRLNGKAVIAEAVADRLLGPHFAVTGHGVYTYGLNKVVYGGNVLFAHGGGLKGVSSAGGFLQDRGIAGACLTNIGGADATRILAGAFNLITGRPADRHTHNYILSDRKPAEPNMFEGYFGFAEGGLSAVREAFKVLQNKDGLTVTFPSGEQRILHYCGETLFLAAKEGADPLRDGMVMRFLVRNGKAWALYCSTRILQRV